MAWPKTEGGEQKTDTSSQYFRQGQYYGKYNTSHPERGLCLVFNVDGSTGSPGSASEMSPREGSAHDVERIEAVFGNMGFQVKKYHNPSAADVRQALRDAAKDDINERADCFVCWIMAHGKNGIIIAADGNPLSLNVVPKVFDVDSLRGKPKLFFVQACQGSEDDARAQWGYSIPRRPDFLFSFAAAPGCAAWRVPEKGSVYVQSLCDALEGSARKYELLELTDILDSTARAVAVKFESHVPSDGSRSKCKQVPCYLSTLTKSLYLTTRPGRKSAINS